MEENKKTDGIKEKERKKDIHKETHIHTSKDDSKPIIHEHKPDEKDKKEVKINEVKESDKKSEPKEKKEKPRVKKELAIVRAPSVHISKRHGMYICSFIKGKSIDKAISELEEVIILKRAIPFKGEIPHRKGNIMSGRYPVVAAKIFISMLKNLKGGVLFNGMDITKSRISSAYTNFARKPQRRGGMKGKRASVTIEARELNK